MKIPKYTISKGFKLMDRLLPINVLLLLEDWFGKCFTCVKLDSLFVTFRDSSLLDTANLCPADLVMNFLFIYFDVWFCMLVHFRW